MSDKSKATLTVTIHKIISFAPLLPVMLYSIHIARKRGFIIGWVWNDKVRTRTVWL